MVGVTMFACIFAFLLHHIPHHIERQVLCLPKYSFKGGVHPLHSQHEGKLPTRNAPIRDFVSDSVVIPMSMHLGAPSKPCVSKGDHVKIGQLIGEPVGGLGLPVHASISGEVTAVEPRLITGAGPVMCVCIQNDFADEWVDGIQGYGNVETVDPALIVPAIKAAGICGMGGASFPAHVKLTLPEGKTCDTIILNGAECETFLTADYRLMIEEPRRVVDGLRAEMRALGVKRGVIAIEDNKMEAIESMRKAAAGREGVEIAVLRTKYPQGGEKQLIHAVTGKVVNPSNLRVRIGTVVADMIGECGGYSEEAAKIVMGGGMTGVCTASADIPIAKANGGIVVYNEKDAKSVDEEPCIRCARCVQACPMGLDPYKLKHLCDAGNLEGAKANHVMDCILCGCCSYACPSRRWLTAAFKNTKDAIAAAARRK